MTNTEIWDKLKRVPPEHLKGFQRAGGFKGTAIKPMWTIHRMTEVFGPVGQGWGMDKPEFTVTDTTVYCAVSIWHTLPSGGRSSAVWGLGGEAITGRADDEAFKKAYTDALTNALKMLGAGADVHMGLWDGNKYVDEKPAEPEVPAVMMASNGTKGASKASAREAFAKMVGEIRNAPTTAALKTWYQSKVTEIEALPADWLDELRIEYADRKADLEKVLA